MKELRIGNKVKVTISNDAGIYQVLGIPAWGMDGCGNGEAPLIMIDRCPKQLVTEKQLKGIPLSPEILEKCGEKDEEEYHQYKLNKHFFVVWDGVDAVWYIIRNGKNVQIATTEYLHQLQNLYFSLVGEELNYTP